MEETSVEVLQQAVDELEWYISTVQPNYLDIDQQAIASFQNLLQRVSNAGIDVSDFEFVAADFNDGRNIYNATFLRRASNAERFLKRQLARTHGERLDAAVAMDAQFDVVPNSVFVIHGQDGDAVNTVFGLLREVALVPRVFDDARRMTRHPMPYIGDVLETAFRHAQAVLAIFTPDEHVELKERLRGNLPNAIEFQPRPNVLIEAGTALATHPDRTIILELGTVRSISDLAGRHFVRWRDDTPAERSQLLDRLEDAGCHPIREGDRWLNVGRVENPTWR